MKSKAPWTILPDVWKTESAFWVWVRGVLRKGWSKHPIKLEYIKRYRVKIKNPKPNKRFPEVWGMICECCKKPTIQTQIEIDHKGEEGHFTGLNDVKDYVAHLFLVDFDSLRAVCKPCHKIISYSQRSGMSFTEASTEKEIIRLMKKENKDELLAILESFGYNAKNAKQRREALREIFQEEK